MERRWYAETFAVSIFDPERAKTRGKVRTGIEADCFSRRRRKQLTLGNEGAIPSVAHRGATAPPEQVESPRCTAVNSQLSVLLYFPLYLTLIRRNINFFYRVVSAL